VGKLINFEGIDGSGKRSQSKLLVNKLEELGYTVQYYSYPEYGSIYGKILHDFLYSKIDLSVEEQFLVYLLDMVKNTPIIQKQLAQGDMVIMDRYYISTIVYQCANGFDFDKAKQFASLLELPVPDLVIHMDVPVEVSYSRKFQQKNDVDRFEGDLQLLEKVSIFYNRMIQDKFPTKNWLCLSGLETKFDIHQTIMKKISNLLDIEK
jgi:dTMP kinase